MYFFFVLCVPYAYGSYVPYAYFRSFLELLKFLFPRRKNSVGWKTICSDAGSTRLRKKISVVQLLLNVARTIKFTHKEPYGNTHGVAYFFMNSAIDCNLYSHARRYGIRAH